MTAQKPDWMNGFQEKFPKLLKEERVSMTYKVYGGISNIKHTDCLYEVISFIEKVEADAYERGYEAGIQKAMKIEDDFKVNILNQ